MCHDSDKEIKISLTSEELHFIFSYQLASKTQFIKLTKMREQLVSKRPNFKRANFLLTLDDLDALLVNIAKEANKDNNLPENQYLLDKLFGKLADKYNSNLDIEF